MDDKGNIIIISGPDQDDCPLVPTEQLSGQDCQSYLSDQLIAFDIQADPLRAKVGEQVNFIPTIIGNIRSLSRDF